MICLRSPRQSLRSYPRYLGQCRRAYITVTKFSDRPLPANFWMKYENRRAYLDFLKEQLIKNDDKLTLCDPNHSKAFEALYSVTRKIIHATHGAGLLSYYHGSAALAIADIYRNDYEWKLWRFNWSPRNYWPRLARRFAARDPSAIIEVREYIDYLANTLRQSLSENEYRNIVAIKEDDERISRKILTAIPKNTLRIHLGERTIRRLSHFGGLENVLSVINHYESKSDNVIEASVKTLNNSETVVIDNWYSAKFRRNFLDGLIGGNVNALHELYSLSSSKLRALEGQTLASLYNSASLAVQVEYPEHAWRPWKFAQSPRKWWDDLAEVFNASRDNLDAVCECVLREYLEEIAAAHSITRLEDWYYVSANQLGDTAADHFKRFGRISNVLVRLFPEHTWSLPMFKSGGRTKISIQRSLRNRINRVLPVESNKRSQ